MRNDNETPMKCLICNSPSVKRGLCSKHYERFRRAKNELPLAVRDSYEAFVISKKKLLPREENRKLVPNDDFIELSIEFLKNTTGMVDQEIKNVAEKVEKFKKGKKDGGST